MQTAAKRWTDGGAEVSGTCVAVNVSAINSGNMASTVAFKHSVTLAGLGGSSKTGTMPDVWIPDSTTWLMRLRAEATGFTPTDGKSVAKSPVVVAMPEPVAQAAGWPDRKLGWKDLIAKMTKGDTMSTGTVEPTRDAAGLSGLLALSSAVGTSAAGQAQQVGALRALAAGSSTVRDDLMAKFPRSADAADLASGISAAPLSEEDVIAYNAEKPAVPLTALYLDPQPLPLDYPYAVMPGVDLTKAAAATGLREALQQPSFKDELAKVGLRGADGTVGAGFQAPVGAPATMAAGASSSGSNASNGGTAAAGLDASTINKALGGWTAVTEPGRVLAVFDVSGSMSDPVPTADNLSRAAVTRAAAAKGLSLFDSKWAVGVWVFSTEMTGKLPYKQLVDISSVSSAESELRASIEQIRPKTGGGTGLYNTALAAYKKVQETWQPSRVNSVILFTDGQDSGPEGGLTRDQLVSALKKVQDPKRPVRLVIIGIGDEVDSDELEAIAKATSAGGVFIVPDPAKISDIFLEAIASRSGASG